jgi:hypothetical protein
MESAKGYSKKFWEALRIELKAKQEEFGSWPKLGEKIGVKGNTLLSFSLGRSKGLSQETLDKLHEIGIDISRLVEETKEETEKEALPLDGWIGETKTPKQAAQDKGYCEGTIRKKCKEGKLDYVKKGKRIAVAINEKYQALPETEKAVLRKEVARLKDENQSLRKELEEIKSGQQRFSFMDEPAEESAPAEEPTEEPKAEPKESKQKTFWRVGEDGILYAVDEKGNKIEEEEEWPEEIFAEQGRPGTIK